MALSSENKAKVEAWSQSERFEADMQTISSYVCAIGVLLAEFRTAPVMGPAMIANELAEIRRHAARIESWVRHLQEESIGLAFDAKCADCGRVYDRKWMDADHHAGQMCPSCGGTITGDQ